MQQINYAFINHVKLSFFSHSLQRFVEMFAHFEKIRVSEVMTINKLS